ncbi:tRNA (N(6)-L-threonylcarbamoyladenosine(37)-C(2))-methylthiotransferase MtaB [Candidatus Omnitrophota bacterium]
MFDTKTVKFFTLGCKVNQYETQVMREQLLHAGFKEADNGKADVYIINTCTVTSRADRKSLNYIKKAFKENSSATVLAVGCLAEKDRDAIAALGKIDIIAGNEAKKNIAALINSKNESTLQRESQINFFAGHSRAFIKIQDGCNNHCAYCKVPHVRGKSRSRDFEEIRDEAQRLIKNGYKELVLCGICLGSYGRDLQPQRTLVEVIDAIEAIAGDFRIRLSSIEARDITDDLIVCMADSKRLCHHLHIPFQSGDDYILQRMQRRYSAADYKKVVDALKERVPDIAITTDILVGFPGEEEEHFLNTLAFLRHASPSRVHVFPFSPRKGTAAFGFSERVPMKEIKARIEKVNKLASNSSYGYRKQFLYKKLRVLFEEKKDRKTGFSKGYTDTYIEVVCKNLNGLPNKLSQVIIAKVTPSHTIARL